MASRWNAVSEAKVIVHLELGATATLRDFTWPLKPNHL